jgi:hypothetical protein
VRREFARERRDFTGEAEDLRARRGAMARGGGASGQASLEAKILFRRALEYFVSGVNSDIISETVSLEYECSHSDIHIKTNTNTYIYI